MAGGLAGSADFTWMLPLLSGRSWWVMMVSPASFASLRSGVTRNGCTVNMASGLSRPSRVLKKARSGEAGRLRKPVRAVM